MAASDVASGDQQLEAPPRVGLRAQQAQRRAEPLGGAGGRPRGRLAPGLDQHRDRRLVAGGGAALEVVRSGRGGRAARLQRGRRARVRLDPPALARGLEHRLADDRVAHPVLARHPRALEEARVEQVVQRPERLGRGEPGGRGGELELGRLSRHRGAPGEPAGRLAERRDLLAERRGDRRRHARHRLAAAGGREAGRLPRPGTGELFEVERVPAARAEELGPHARADARAQQRAGLLLVERAELDLGQAAVAAGGLHRGRDPARQPADAEGERPEGMAARRAAEHVGQQLERGVVGPVQVVEDQHDAALGAGQPLEQGVDGAVGAEALVLQAARCGRLRGAVGRGRGQDPRQLPQPVAHQPLEA